MRHNRRSLFQTIGNWVSTLLKTVCRTRGSNVRPDVINDVDVHRGRGSCYCDVNGSASAAVSRVSSLDRTDATPTRRTTSKDAAAAPAHTCMQTPMHSPDLISPAPAFWYFIFFNFLGPCPLYHDPGRPKTRWRKLFAILVCIFFTFFSSTLFSAVNILDRNTRARKYKTYF